MLIPSNIIANADDLGLNQPVNRAILFCFEKGYINSASLITNSNYFNETVDLIHNNPVMQNIGVHVNLIEGKPVTNFGSDFFLDANGNWNGKKISSKVQVLSSRARSAFLKEIFAQIEKALDARIKIRHLDSHYHLHTLPCFLELFLKAAKHYNLKLRIAQTFSEGNPFNFFYRRLINLFIAIKGSSYSDYFEDIDHFLNKRKNLPKNKKIELMLHPCFVLPGELTDHYDNKSVTEWIYFLRSKKAGNG